MGLKQDIRDSADYKKFKKIVQQVEGRLNVEKDQSEAIALHAGRTSRKLYGEKRYSPKALIDASENDLSVRSRLIEMRVKASMQIDTLNDACKAMKSSMLTNFQDRMKKMFGTVGDRNAFMDTMIASALEVERDGSALIKALDTLIQDIDKASYHLKGVIECLGMLESSKGGKVI